MVETAQVTISDFKTIIKGVNVSQEIEWSRFLQKSGNPDLSIKTNGLITEEYRAKITIKDNQSNVTN